MKQLSVPKTKVPAKREVVVDISSMIVNYVILADLIQLLRHKGHQQEAVFFAGISRGYEDWFAFLGISAEKVNEVFGKLPMDLVRRISLMLYERLFPVIEVPGQQVKTPRQLWDGQAVQDLFEELSHGEK